MRKILIARGEEAEEKLAEFDDWKIESTNSIMVDEYYCTGTVSGSSLVIIFVLWKAS